MRRTGVGADLAFFVAGVALLLMGGEGLVRGASDIAYRFGVAPVIVGLTVVAFGTSTPELVVNLAAAFRGSSELGFGNVVGSNTANIGLILGISALVAPLAVHRTVAVREIPMMILACAAVVTMAMAGGVRGGGFDRTDGVLLLLLFGIFLYYTFADALRQRQDAFLTAASEAAPSASATADATVLRSALFVLGGLGLLVLGGELTIRGASSFATDLGIDEAIVGLSIVAVGTSLPELATSVTAARRGMSDMAVGNVVGSNIYNLLFVWGTSVTVAPSAVPRGGMIDLLVMTGFCLVLVPIVTMQSRIGRVQGASLLVAYAGYVIWLAMR